MFLLILNPIDAMACIVVVIAVVFGIIAACQIVDKERSLSTFNPNGNEE